MPALVNFSDFIKATNEHVITPPGRILNDAVENTYFIREMVRGRDVSKIIRGGSKVTDRIMLEDNGSFAHYSSNDEFNPTGVSVLRKIEQPWRFAKANYSFTDEEILLNDGDDRDVFKDLKKSYTQAAMTSKWNGMEAALFAVPNADTMEVTSGAQDEDPGVPTSLPAFVTSDVTNFHAPGFTTLETLDPDTETRWRNQVSTYNQGEFESEENGIFAAFDDMWLSVGFEAPDTASDYFDNDKLRRMKIVTDKLGRRIYSRLLRASNDRLLEGQDPAYNGPTFSGIPVLWASALDNKAVWDDPDNTGTLTTAGTNPRYMWLNLEYIWPVYHAKRYMTMIGPIPGGPKQPFSHVVYYNTYWQLFMQSRQRQGIVAPAAAA